MKEQRARSRALGQSIGFEAPARIPACCDSATPPLLPRVPPLAQLAHQHPPGQLCLYDLDSCLALLLRSELRLLRCAACELNTLGLEHLLLLFLEGLRARIAVRVSSASEQTNNFCSAQP